MITAQATLRPQQYWMWFDESTKLHLKIVRWEASPDMIVWNYYIHIYERYCPAELFAKLWLEDQLMRIAPDCPERITHGYYSTPMSSVDFHGGITFYQKHGYSPGHRSVEFGCDYNHLHDIPGSENSVEKVFSDANATMQEIKQLITSYSDAL